MANSIGYSLTSYGQMITDLRMESYVQALRRTVRPGDIVVDIGAGTGIFSLLACQMGAGHVHVIEPDDAIQVARQNAAANGYADRITFHQALSTDVSLPAPADVIISDLRGALPLFQHHIPSIVDARTRLLAPGGALIPNRDSLWAALVEDPDTYRPYAEPWLRNEYGLDMSAGQPLVVNTMFKTYLKPDRLLVPPQQWAILDYTTIESPNLAGEPAWKIERAGTAHGLLLWFDAVLVEGVGFSNAPGEPKLTYNQMFFPLQEPVALEPGDAVSVRLRADLIEGGYIWQWKTRIQGSRDGSIKANLAQSTFFGTPVSVDTFRKKQTGFRPLLDKAGQADRFILVLMDGSLSLDEIADRAWREYPAVFIDRKQALTRVGELSVKYAR